MITPWITKINNIEHGKVKVDESVYSVPQFIINHITLQEQAIIDRDKQIAELQEKLKASENRVSIMIQHESDLRDRCKDQIRRRNLQIKDLKKKVSKYQQLVHPDSIQDIENV